MADYFIFLMAMPLIRFRFFYFLMPHDYLFICRCAMLMMPHFFDYAAMMLMITFSLMLTPGYRLSLRWMLSSDFFAAMPLSSLIFSSFFAIYFLLLISLRLFSAARYAIFHAARHC